MIRLIFGLSRRGELKRPRDAPPGASVQDEPTDAQILPGLCPDSRRGLPGRRRPISPSGPGHCRLHDWHLPAGGDSNAATETGPTRGRPRQHGNRPGRGDPDRPDGTFSPLGRQLRVRGHRHGPDPRGCRGGVLFQESHGSPGPRVRTNGERHLGLRLSLLRATTFFQYP